MSQIIDTIIATLASWSRQLAQLTKLNFHQLDFNLLLGIFFVVAVLVVAFGLGRSRLMLVVISTYIAVWLKLIFPYTAALKKLLPLDAFQVDLLIFVVFLLIIFFILGHSILRGRASLQDSSLLAILLLSFTEVGLLASIVIGYWLKHPSLIKIPANIVSYFNTTPATLIWSLLPLLVIAFIKRHRDYSG